jgi:hypothetical protein
VAAGGAGLAGTDVGDGGVVGDAGVVGDDVAAEAGDPQRRAATNAAAAAIRRDRTDKGASPAGLGEVCAFREDSDVVWTPGRCNRPRETLGLAP